MLLRVVRRKMENGEDVVLVLSVHPDLLWRLRDTCLLLSRSPSDGMCYLRGLQYARYAALSWSRLGLSSAVTF